jgi:ribonucleoside-triphosphate reductase
MLGLINYERTKMPDVVFKFSKRQSNLFIKTWAEFDGSIASKEYGRIRLQCDNNLIADQMQHVCFLAGLGSYKSERLIGNNKNPTIRVVPYSKTVKTESKKYRINYNGIVWCPTTKDGIVVYRKNGRIFISGNSPFTNISLFDRNKIKTLIKDKPHYFPNEGNRTQSDHVEYIIEYIIELQKLFLDFFDKGDPLTNGTPLRFPIVTCNISKDVNGNIKDKEFLEDICNREIYRYNIFVS